MGGRMINRLGEDFFQNMTPEMRKAGRIGQNMAIKREIEEGRGPIYEDYAINTIVMAQYLHNTDSFVGPQLSFLNLPS